MAEKRTLNDAEEVELELKRLQIELFREQLEASKERKSRIQQAREKTLLDMKKAAAELEHRQRICKHRKGGKNNNFAMGNDENRSIIQNTYPLGDVCLMCTRCGKEVWRPKLALKKTNPELYALMAAEWKEWANWPTDNTPSGGKIFELAS
jgi:hypothetical protein